MAAVAMANGVNANLVRRWVLESETEVAEQPARVAAASPKPATQLPSSFLQVPLPSPPSTPAVSDIRIELQRGATKVVVTWPATAASECAAWMRELLQ